MMFIITTPPTTSEIAAIAIATPPMLAIICCSSPASVSLVSSVKLSGSPGRSCRSPRTIIRAWSLAASIAGAPLPDFA